MNVIPFPIEHCRCVYQSQMINGDTADNYAKRGGLIHYMPAKGNGTLCGNGIGGGVRKVWKQVTCLFCFRARATIRKERKATLRNTH